jgi:hypothetical protein
LRKWRNPPLRLQVSACNTFLMMCDVPSSEFFFDRIYWMLSWYCFQLFLKLLLTVPVAQWLLVPVWKSISDPHSLNFYTQDSYVLISSQLYYYYYYYYALFIAQYSQGYWSHFAPCHTSRRKPGIANKAHHVGFVVNKVALGQVLLQVLRVPCK